MHIHMHMLIYMCSSSKRFCLYIYIDFIQAKQNRERIQAGLYFIRPFVHHSSVLIFDEMVLWTASVNLLAILISS